MALVRDCIGPTGMKTLEAQWPEWPGGGEVSSDAAPLPNQVWQNSK